MNGPTQSPILDPSVATKCADRYAAQSRSEANTAPFDVTLSKVRGERNEVVMPAATAKESEARTKDVEETCEVAPDLVGLEERCSPTLATGAETNANDQNDVMPSPDATREFTATVEPNAAYALQSLLGIACARDAAQPSHSAKLPLTAGQTLAREIAPRQLPHLAWEVSQITGARELASAMSTPPFAPEAAALVSGLVKVVHQERHLAPVQPRVNPASVFIAAETTMIGSNDRAMPSGAPMSVHPIELLQDSSANAGSGSAGPGAGPGQHRDLRSRELDLVAAPAPEPASSVVWQVADAIIDAAPAPNGDVSRSGKLLSFEGDQPVSRPALRVLKITLAPELLGTVSVILAVQDQSINVRLVAEQAQTTEHLEADRAALVERITASGYVLDGLSIICGSQANAAPPESSQDTNTPMNRNSAFDGSGITGQGSHQSAERQSNQHGRRGAAKNPSSIELTVEPSRPSGTELLQHYQGRRPLMIV